MRPKKVQWIRLSGAGLGGLISNIVGNPKVGGPSFKFEQLKSRVHTCSGLLSHETIVRESIVTPLRGTQQIERLVTLQYWFNLRTDLGILELFDPPRSIKPFLMTLAKAAGFNISTVVASVSPLAWYEWLRDSGYSDFVLKYIECRDIQLQSKGTLSFEINASDRATETAMEINTRANQHIHKVRAFSYQDGFACELARRGYAKSAAGFDERAMKCLRGYVTASTSKR